MQDHLTALCARVRPHLRDRITETPIPRVRLTHAIAPTAPVAGVYQPMVCLMLQGAKQVMIGDQVIRYDPATCFIASLELPASGCIVEASVTKPYIAVSLTLDTEMLAALLTELPQQPRGEAAAFGTRPVTPQMLEAWGQLLALLDTPEDIAMLGPAREREVLYRLIQGPDGEMLRQIARIDSRLSQVRRAIGWLQAHYDQPVRIEMLADLAGMSLASFHRHFKAATAMSPLQFQKVLRLQAARRLLATRCEASRAAYQVGYESASQFSREYARLFGAPPARDAERLRAAPAELDVA